MVNKTIKEVYLAEACRHGASLAKMITVISAHLQFKFVHIHNLIRIRKIKR